MPEAAEFRNVATHLENCVRNIVHVFPSAEKKMVGKPNRFFVRRALGDRAVVKAAQIEWLRAAPAERRPIAWVRRKERALVDRFVKLAIARDAFHFERAEKRG